MADALLDVTGLACKRGGRWLVRGLSLVLPRGGVVGLVGANGGGKTTTLRMLAGLLRPSEGKGHVLQAPVTSPARPWVQIGYMSQQTALYPELTVRENLSFRGTAYKLERAGARIAELVDRAGLSSMLDRRAGQLSGGWAKRVHFAATILHDPQLLLLDEPTAGLDAVTRQAMWRWIGDAAAAGRGVLVSTHDLYEAETLERIIYYEEGVAQPAQRPRDLVAQMGATSLEEAVIEMASAAR